MNLITKAIEKNNSGKFNKQISYDKTKFEVIEKYIYFAKTQNEANIITKAKIGILNETNYNLAINQYEMQYNNWQLLKQQHEMNVTIIEDRNERNIQIHSQNMKNWYKSGERGPSPQKLPNERKPDFNVLKPKKPNIELYVDYFSKEIEVEIDNIETIGLEIPSELEKVSLKKIKELIKYSEKTDYIIKQDNLKDTQKKFYKKCLNNVTKILETNYQFVKDIKIDSPFITYNFFQTNVKEVILEFEGNKKTYIFDLEENLVYYEGFKDKKKILKTTGVFLSILLISLFIYFKGNSTFFTRNTNISKNQIKLENNLKDDFIGKYNFYKEEVSYNLEISKKGTKYIALYNAEGRQTWENWKCIIKQDGNLLQIYAKEFIEGQNFVKTGDLVFTLKKETNHYLGKTEFDNKFYEIQKEK